MRHRMYLVFGAAFAGLLAALSLLVALPAAPVGAYVCGPTGSIPETNSKLQIFVSGDRVNEVQWAFKITPNPFTLGGSLRVVDNQSIDVNRSLNDILLEDVCTTVTGETYTVALDTTVPPPCPLETNTLTRAAPQPTPLLSDPETAAFYFVAKCLPPTPVPPTPTPIPPPTPIIPPTPTPVPVPPGLDVAISPSYIGCHSSGLVTVTLRGHDPDADIFLSTSAGIITPVIARASNGILLARLDLSSVTSVQTNQLISARTTRASGAVPFTIGGCPDATPVPPLYPPYFPPPAVPAPNGPVIINNQQQQQQQQGAGAGGAQGQLDTGGFGSNAQGQILLASGPGRITPPRTGEVDWSSVLHGPAVAPDDSSGVQQPRWPAYLLHRLRGLAQPACSGKSL